MSNEVYNEYFFHLGCYVGELQKRSLNAIIARQREWSLKTFGPGYPASSRIDHIRKELLEIELDPSDPVEWIDVALIALDGAWRTGIDVDRVVELLQAKQAQNEERSWPDWREAEPGKAIEHVREDPAEKSVKDCASRFDPTKQPEPAGTYDGKCAHDFGMGKVFGGATVPDLARRVLEQDAELDVLRSELNVARQALHQAGRWCDECENAIDPDTCHCGGSLIEHGGDHMFVPMGCRCGYAKESDR